MLLAITSRQVIRLGEEYTLELKQANCYNEMGYLVIQQLSVEK